MIQVEIAFVKLLCNDLIIKIICIVPQYHDQLHKKMPALHQCNITESDIVCVIYIYI